jgi:hypothetical protein
MSQRQCPNCHYTFLKKKDFINHITYSSCAENLHDLLVLCPHCNKQFPNEDSLSYHLLRNKSCSSKQDQAIDLFNRLPCNSSIGAAAMGTEQGSRKWQKAFDGISDSTGQSTEIFHIHQGVVAHTHYGFDNEQVTSTSNKGERRTKNKIFVSLEKIQGARNEDRPYFPIKTLHQTQAWRQSSSLDPSIYLHKNKHVMLDKNIQTALTTSIPSMEENKLSSQKGVEENWYHPQDHDNDSISNSRSSSVSQSVADDVDNVFNAGDDNDDVDSDIDNQHVEVWDTSIKDVLHKTVSVEQHHSRLLFSDETICLTDLYATLNRRGIPASLFDTLSKWAWNNRKLLSKMNEPPMKRKKISWGY